MGQFWDKVKLIETQRDDKRSEVKSFQHPIELRYEKEATYFLNFHNRGSTSHTYQGLVVGSTPAKQKQSLCLWQRLAGEFVELLTKHNNVWPK